MRMPRTGAHHTPCEDGALGCYVLHAWGEVMHVAQRAGGTLDEGDALLAVLRLAADVCCDLARGIAYHPAHCTQLHRRQRTERPRRGRPAGALLRHRQQRSAHAARQGDAFSPSSSMSQLRQASAAQTAALCRVLELGLLIYSPVYSVGNAVWGPHSNRHHLTDCGKEPLTLGKQNS